MWTLIIKKADSTVAGFMSAETTRENLGDYPEADFDIKYVEDSAIPATPLLGATISDLEGTVKITASVNVVQEINWKTEYTAAKTDSERIAIIAKKLGLVEAK